MKQWSLVKLGEVLKRVERFEPRDDLAEYPFAGTYSLQAEVDALNRLQSESTGYNTAGRAGSGV